MSVEIRVRPSYYEAYIDGERVGELGYRQGRGVVTATHTEVSPAAEGKGIGSSLARRFLDDARERGDTVVPLCPFVNGWINKHPDYADLVAR
jgi:uncharacterized protein